MADDRQQRVPHAGGVHAALPARGHPHHPRPRTGGDGRTVEAYAAVFDDPAEINDHEGHYIEDDRPVRVQQGHRRRRPRPRRVPRRR